VFTYQNKLIISKKIYVLIISFVVCVAAFFRFIGGTFLLSASNKRKNMFTHQQDTVASAQASEKLNIFKNLKTATLALIFDAFETFFLAGTVSDTFEHENRTSNCEFEKEERIVYVAS
jgi:hypothetical protein